MTYVLCKLKGTGDTADPYRCDFPTYVIVAHSLRLKLAIVDVRDEDVPADAPKRTISPVWAAPRTFTVCVVDAGIKSKWNDRIRKRYQEGHKNWDADAAVET